MSSACLQAPHPSRSEGLWESARQDGVLSSSHPVLIHRGSEAGGPSPGTLLSDSGLDLFGQQQAQPRAATPVQHWALLFWVWFDLSLIAWQGGS